MHQDHFKPTEFREWWLDMDKSLLLKLDGFRELLELPVEISPVRGAIGRHKGLNNKSYHNVDYHRNVKAIDVMPIWNSPDDYQRAITAAETVGFGGIGFYPAWQPRPGMHLDVRPTPLHWWTVLENEKQKYVYITYGELLRRTEGMA